MSAFRSHLSPETPNYIAKSKLSLQCVFLDASLGCGCPHACTPACVDMNSRCWQSHRSASLTVTVSPASSQTSIESLIQDRNTAKPSVRTNPDSGLSSHLPTAPQPALPDGETLPSRWMLPVFLRQVVQVIHDVCRASSEAAAAADGL